MTVSNQDAPDVGDLCIRRHAPDGGPVAGATVTGDFGGPSSDTTSGTTDAAGQVVLTSSRVRNPVGEWCFLVTNVELSGATYDAAQNVVTEACESRPVRFLCPRGRTVRTGFCLAPNHPNPFNPVTEIDFTLPSAGSVRLEVFDVRGRRVEILVDGNLSSGAHRVTWDARNQASGTYLCRLTTRGSVETVRMQLVK